MGLTGFPEVGEEYEQINGHLVDSFLRRHHQEGLVLKVISYVNGNVTFNQCACKAFTGHGCTWTWNSYKTYFRKAQKITLEEDARAKDLPPIEDVMSFFSDRESYLRDKARQDFVTALNNVVKVKMTEFVSVLDSVKREPH